MAGQRSKRRSRKRRQGGGTPGPVASDRREQLASERRAQREIVERARAERLSKQGTQGKQGAQGKQGKQGGQGRQDAPRAETPPAPRRRARNAPPGERPQGMFGGVPVSEIAILAGIVAVVVGYLRGGGTTLLVGVALCALGVIEFTAREHFSGYRSHATLLAAIPAVATEFILVELMPSSWPRATALIGDVIVFSVLFWLLRGRFLRARQARLARVAQPPRTG